MKFLTNLHKTLDEHKSYLFRFPGVNRLCWVGVVSMYGQPKWIILIFELKMWHKMVKFKIINIVPKAVVVGML